MQSEWLRYALRLALIFLMLRYGFMKVFPLQMPPPSLAVLNEQVGQTSPMTRLWTLIGLHPTYEMIAGAIEIAAAMLLTFRRSALLGALLTVAVMTNVLLYNLFFDVPVKLGAINVLVLGIAVIVPDGRALYRFFFQRRLATLSSEWAPAMKGTIRQRAVRILEVCIVCSAFMQFAPMFRSAYAAQSANVKHPSPLTGEWHVDSVSKVDGGKTVDLPVLTGEGLRMVALYLEPNGNVMVRSADGRLWRAQASIDLARHTFDLDSGYFEGDRFSATYRLTQPDPNHLFLQPLGAYIKTNGTMALTRVLLADHHPLLDRRFTWVNEWALER